MSIAVRLVAPLAAALVAGSAAVAQPAPAGGSGPDLSALLHLRPEQMGAYTAYKAASQPGPEQVAVLRAASPQALAGLTTPVRLQRLDAALSTQLQLFRRQADAVRAFYGQLSPDQRTSFDQITGQPQGGGRRAPGGG